MTAATSLPIELVEAYRETSYEVDWPNGTYNPLRVGACADRLMASSGIGWAFITAWNPMGQSCSEEQNKSRHQALIDKIQGSGRKWLSGRGRGASGDWPAEESVLVYNIGEEEASDLGRYFAQNAVLWIGPDLVVRLKLLV